MEIFMKKVREVPKTLNEAIQLAKKSKLLPEIFSPDCSRTLYSCR